jgi:hypothetical protein
MWLIDQMQEGTQQVTDAIAAGFRKGIEGILCDAGAGLEQIAATYGEQALVLAAMFGILFWGAGSRTGGRVVWWSIFCFALLHAFGPKFWLAIIGMIAARMILGGR